MNLKDLNNLISEILSIPEKEVTNNSKLKNIPSWDSMNHMILIARIEEEYNVLFTGDEIIEMVDVKTIKSFLKSKGIKE